MHFDKLLQLAIQELAPFVPTQTVIHSVNMEEDISGGAIRLSHLIVEHRVSFDPRLVNHGVVSTGQEDQICTDMGEYRVTCIDDYVTACEEYQWKSYATVTEEEMRAYKQRFDCK